jgi:hypothetical protein
MSTYLYLECHSHAPPLRAPDESGQHLYDLPHLRATLRMGSEKIKDYLLQYRYESYADGWDVFHGYYFGNTARFLKEHPGCDIKIIDELGVEHPTFDPDD